MNRQLNKLVNLFFYPVIVFGCILYLRRGSGYRNFRQLAYEKMYRGQWRLLDVIMNEYD